MLWSLCSATGEATVLNLCTTRVAITHHNKRKSACSNKDLSKQEWSQDGGGIGRGDHFLFYKFIERTTERWTKITKQLLIASSGHQAPRKAVHCLRREGKKFFSFFFLFLFFVFLLLCFLFFLFSFPSFLLLVFLSYFLLKSSNTPLLFLNFHFHLTITLQRKEKKKEEREKPYF